MHRARTHAIVRRAAQALWVRSMRGVLAAASLTIGTAAPALATTAHGATAHNAMLCAQAVGAPPKSPAIPPPPRTPVGAKPAPAEAPWTIKEDRWYEMLLGGKTCGYSHDTVEERAGQVRTTNASELRLGRMGQGVVIKSRSAFIETAEGKPLEVVIEKETGAAPIRTRWLFNRDSVDVVDEQNGRTNARRLPLPDEAWLTPNQARQFVRRRVEAGAADLQYTTMDAEAGPVAVRVSSTRVGEGTFDMDGKPVTVSRWQTKNSLLDKPSAEEISKDGVLVRSVTDVGVGALESRLSTRERATASRSSVEVMAKTFLPLKQDGSGLLRARTAQLRVRVPGGALADLPSAGAQRFTRSGADAGVVDIALDAPQPMERGDDADTRYRSASVMVDCNDSRVQALADGALRGVRDEPMARVAALRTAVAKHLTRKNFASGFATASEAAASRAGDCTEHSVLLAACLRHAGIPARVASGLVYVEALQEQRNVYGWHMWTQALVDGKWVDADAVLPPNGPLSHAGHLLVVTTRADGATMDAELARIVDLIGALEIELVSLDGVPVAKGAAK